MGITPGVLTILIFSCIYGVVIAYGFYRNIKHNYDMDDDMFMNRELMWMGIANFIVSGIAIGLALAAIHQQ